MTDRVENDLVKFPANFFDIGEQTFISVFNSKPDYVQFTIDDMKDPTGLFKQWKDYCIEKKSTK